MFALASRVCVNPVIAQRVFVTRAFSSAAAATQTGKNVDVGGEKISRLVDDISNLSLHEASVLVQELKTRLNIKDIVAAQPVAATPTNAGNAAPVEEAEKPKEKTEFTITLEKFDAASKAKVIREMKAILPGINLVEAKKFVESAPKTIMENAPKEQVEKIKKALEAVGATVKVE